jgi:hypothetical protein
MVGQLDDTDTDSVSVAYTGSSPVLTTKQTRITIDNINVTKINYYAKRSNNRLYGC